MKYDVILYEKEALSGMTSKEALHAMRSLKTDSFYPLEIGSKQSYAVGFITTEAAEWLDYEYTELSSPFVGAVGMILDQPSRFESDGNYCIQGLQVSILQVDKSKQEQLLQVESLAEETSGRINSLFCINFNS